MIRKNFTFIFLALFALSFYVVPVLGHEKPQQIQEQSSQQTADAAILGLEGYFFGIIVITDAVNSVQVDAYDNATGASGDKLFPTWEVTTSVNDRIQTLSFDPPLDFSNGIYVDITTSGTAKYMVYYRTK